MSISNLLRRKRRKNMLAKQDTASKKHTGRKPLKTPSHKGLLDIPPELRLIIYSFLPRWCVSQTIHTDLSLTETYAPTREIKMLASLRRTCKVLHFETREKLYSCLQVRIQDYPNCSYATEQRTTAMLNKSIGLDGHLRHVQDIDIRVTLQPSAETDVGLAYVRRIKAFVDALRLVGHLRRFKFVLVPWTCYDLEDSDTQVHTPWAHRSVKVEFDFAYDVISRIERWFDEEARHGHGEDQWIENFRGLRISDGAVSVEQAG